MDYKEFLHRFLINHEEFSFKYEDKIIDLLNGPNGIGFSYYFYQDIEAKPLFYRIRHRNDYISTRNFASPQELLDAFKLDGKTLYDLWDKLEK